MRTIIESYYTESHYNCMPACFEIIFSQMNIQWIPDYPNPDYPNCPAYPNPTFGPLDFSISYKGWIPVHPNSGLSEHSGLSTKIFWPLKAKYIVFCPDYPNHLNYLIENCWITINSGLSQILDYQTFLPVPWKFG